MARKVAKEMTVEEFDDWSAANKKFDAVAEAADEVGGPRLSLVPLPDQNIAWPTDLLPPSEALPIDGGGLGGGDISTGTASLGRHPTPTPPHQGE
jgi:hypothetical protein